MITWNELFTPLTTFPGTLVFHVLISIINITTLIFYRKPKQTTPELSKSRINKWLLLILLLGLINFTIAIPAWYGNAAFNFMHPIILRFATSLVLVWVGWLILHKKELLSINLIAYALTALILIMAIISTVYAKSLSPNNPLNQTIIDKAWIIFSAAICLAAIIFAFATQASKKWRGLIYFSLVFIGCAMHFLLPNIGSLPAYYMLGFLTSYPLILTILPTTSKEEASESKNKNVLGQEKKLDITPRIASALLEIGQNRTTKKVHKAITHAISLMFMMDICSLVRLEESSGELHFLGMYDLIREDYFPDHTQTKSQLPALFQAFQQGRPLVIDEKEAKKDFQSISELISYNQVGEIAFSPIRYNGRKSVFGFLFITPYTWRRIQTSLFEKLDVLGPNLTRLLDYADELDTQNKALDTVQIALNQSNRENERLQEQYERGQNLLAELRNEYNLKKADHEAELKNWENQRQNQDEKIDLLTSQLDQAKEALLQIETLRTKNQIIQNKLVEASEKNRALQEALLRMKTTFDEISATPGIKFDASQDDLEVLSSEESEIHLPAAKKPQDLINPHDFLAQLISDNQNILTEKNINLVTDFHTLPNLIMGDRESIKLIITGLLSNAIKASPNGEQIDLVTTISQSQTGDRNLNIMVTDRGGGLTTQEQNSYFNLIDRVGQPVPGGIGDVEALRNVTRNVRQLNGNLWIKSELSNPTIYHVVIPVFLPLRSEENTDEII